MQVVCQPPGPVLLVVDDYDLEGQGRLRLHLERVGAADCPHSLAASLFLPSPALPISSLSCLDSVHRAVQPVQQAPS